MEQFTEVFRFHLRKLLRQPWLYGAFALAAAFILLYSPDIVLRDGTPFAFAIYYIQQDIVTPLVMLVLTAYLFITESGDDGRMTDSYPVSNGVLFSGIFFSAYAAMMLVSLTAFILILCVKTVCTGDVGLLGCIPLYMCFAVVNGLVFTGLGSLLGIIFKDGLPAFLSAFAAYMAGMFLTTFTSRITPWLDILNWSALKNKGGYSDFGIDALTLRLVTVNRIYHCLAAILLFCLGRLLYKRYRERRFKAAQVAQAALLLLLCASSVIYYNKVQSVASEKAMAKAAAFSGRIVQLSFHDYDISADLGGKGLRASASFTATNDLKHRALLQFHLAESLKLTSLYADGKPVGWTRRGSFVDTGLRVPPGSSAACTVEYGGVVDEYARESNEGYVSVVNKRYAYVDRAGALLPGNCGWYPKTWPIYVNMKARSWVFPGREAIPEDFRAKVTAPFPVLVSHNSVYGSKYLVKTELDGIEYWHHKLHIKAVRKIHDGMIRSQVNLLRDMIPMSPVQVIEIPQDSLAPAQLVENGKGRILLGEDLLVKFETGQLQDWERDMVGRSIFAGWFNFSAPEYGVVVDRRPAESRFYRSLPIDTHPPVHAVWLLSLYINSARNESNFDKGALFDSARRYGYSSSFESLVAFYEKRGYAGTKELFRALYKTDRARGLNEEDIMAYLEKGAVPAPSEPSLK